MHSSFNRLLITAFLIAGTNSMAQDLQKAPEDAYSIIHRFADSALATDPLLQNGIYYTYPYFNAVGHPFLSDGEFSDGSVTFRGKPYAGITLNYDLFNQQLILSHRTDKVLYMNLLNNEFISGFTLKGKRFILEPGGEGDRTFYQVVSEHPNLSCYYYWYKDRREIRDAGNRSIYSFSEQKHSRYLFLDGQLHRFKSNRSFVKLFPDANRTQIKEYLKLHKIQVEITDDQSMGTLIEFCSKCMDKTDKKGI